MWLTRKKEDPTPDDDVEVNWKSLDTHSLAGRCARGQSDAFGEIWSRHHGRMRAMAIRLLRPYRELRRIYAVDDALIDAAYEVTWRARAGVLVDKMNCREDFWPYFRDVLRQCIRDEDERHSALKRGGDGSRRPASSGGRRGFFGLGRGGKDECDDLDRIVSRELGPEAIVLTEDLMRRLLELLDEEDGLIVSLLFSQRSVAEIAEAVGLSRRTISRRIKEIRRIWSQSGELD